MSATKKEIMTDLRYCKESLDRIVKYVNKSFDDDRSYYSHYTVVQTDIIKLRRELNEIRKKLEWDYKV